MGIIAAVTPESKSSKHIPNITVTLEDVCAIGRINIINFYKPHRDGMSTLKYEELLIPAAKDETYNVDVLWKSSWLLKPDIPVPLWNGFMQMVQHGSHPGKSTVIFLPMIDLKSSDETCIYSTMNFVSEQAKRHDVTPVLTFDQPLWWKALDIQRNVEPGSSIKDVVLRLGGLHVEMSFLGTIGHIMGGSGLRELLQLIYADTAVGHMLSGKAISRAIRGHIMIEKVLNGIMLSNIYDIPLATEHADKAEANAQTVQTCADVEESPNVVPIESPSTPTEEIHDTTMEIQPNTETESTNDLSVARAILEALLRADISIETACSGSVFERIQNAITEYKTSAENQRTAMLWMQYLDMIEILRTFIKAERTGQWGLHLHALSQMLPFFAASGHHLYAKSVYLYLQQMLKLNVEHPDILKYFQDGKHVIRRSDRYWAGLSTDLVIEQMLMRSIKTSGGLTHGRGMAESQRAVWLLSTPACADLNQAMQDLTGVLYVSSEQHKDCSKARQSRDLHDMNVIADFLEERNPFSDDTSLCSIASGVVADKAVNVDKARDIGCDIIQSMEGKCVNEFTFKRKNQAVTLDSKHTFKIDDELVHVDPQLLFQRLVTAARGPVSSEDLALLFTYELCTHPPALFDADGLLRAATKSQLAESIWNSTGLESATIPEDVQYVVDGGSLLHRITWPRGSTYGQICDSYVRYEHQKYGKDTVVVFDGYSDEPSTKDNAHVRRSMGHVGKTVNFISNMTMNTKQDLFLAKSQNKQRLITMLAECLDTSGIITRQAEADADVLIVTTARPVVVVGDDTDLLVLLCYYVEIESQRIYFKPEQKKNMKAKVKVWDIQCTKEKLGENMCNNMLFIHAILGCDTTSRLFGIGKGLSLKKFKADEDFRNCATLFDGDNVPVEDIVRSGEEAVVILYNGKSGQSIDEVRVNKFFQKVASHITVVAPENIPPTSAATRQHSLRVFYQIHVWKGKNNLSPEEWGWKVSKRKMIGVQTLKLPAPDHLLKVIRCKCKLDCRTARCTCRKHGLECSPMCGECRGVSCLNSAKLDLTVHGDIRTE